MSYAAYIDGEYVGDIATNRGWADFLSWSERSDSDDVHELANTGTFSGDFDSLTEDLMSANKNTSAGSVAHGLAELLSGSGTLVISDGIGDDLTFTTIAESFPTRMQSLSEMIWKGYP